MNDYEAAYRALRQAVVDRDGDRKAAEYQCAFTDAMIPLRNDGGGHDGLIVLEAMAIMMAQFMAMAPPESQDGMTSYLVTRARELVPEIQELGIGSEITIVEKANDG